MPEQFTDTAFLLKNLMENMTDNIYFKDVESNFIMVNKAFCDWTGFDIDRIVGKSDFDLFAQAHAQQAYDDEQRIIATKEPLIGIEEKETWPDGRITWVSTTKMPLQNAEQEVIGTFGVSRDITDHKEAEFKATLYSEQILRIKDDMDEDVRMAAELQKTFFPSTYPVFPEGVAQEDSCVEFLHHYHASGVVSGDFCTVRKLSDTETGIFLCDVMGHGVRASLGTALICALVEDVAVEENDPGKFLGKMNELLLPILRQDDMFLYATSCYIVLDVATGLVRMANAGHPVPLHFQSKQQTVNWLMDDESLRGPALAIADDAIYNTVERVLEPGDSVVLYTDGLYEVEGEDGEEFGEDRLLEAARKLRDKPLSALYTALAQEACSFAENGAMDDDLCIVGFKFKNASVKGAN